MKFYPKGSPKGAPDLKGLTGSFYRLGAGTVLAAFCAASIAACHAKPDRLPQRPPVPVSAAYSELRTIPVQITAIGTGEAYSTVSVKSMVSGQIMKVFYKDGQYVRKGQLLFEIDRRPYEAALLQARANMARDKAIYQNDKRDAKRYELLVKKDYVPREQYDQIRSNAVAQGAVVDADKAAIQNIMVQLDYCMIRSPIDGRTGSTQIQLGNVVKANDVPMLTIARVNPIYVDFSVPERYLPEIKKYNRAGGLKVAAAIPGLPANAPEMGRLTFINNQVDAATGTILLKGTFPNAKRLLWPGQFANVTVELTTAPNSVIVPSQAVQNGQEGQYVFVIKPDMSVDMRPVRTGVTYDGFTVIEKGISQREHVVTDGQMRLVPGAKVSIKPPIH